MMRASSFFLPRTPDFYLCPKIPGGARGLLPPCVRYCSPPAPSLSIPSPPPLSLSIPSPPTFLIYSFFTPTIVILSFSNPLPYPFLLHPHHHSSFLLYPTCSLSIPSPPPSSLSIILLKFYGLIFPILKTENFNFSKFPNQDQNGC